MAFLVDADVPAEAVPRAARNAERKLIAGVTLFDVIGAAEARTRELEIEGWRRR